MRALILVLFTFASVQEEPKEWLIQRTIKDPYINALRELDRANGLIDGEPREAIAKITAILSNSKIKYFECRLKIEMRPAEFERYTFFPYLARAKAYMAVAKRASDPNTAKPSFESAIEDLQKSVDAKVGGAADQLAAAKAALEKCKAEIKALEKVDDPVVEFRRKWDRLIADSKFKSAMNYVEGADGQKITEEQRQQFRTETDDGCAKFVEGKLYRLRQNLGDATAKGLKDMDGSTFRRQFTDQIPGEGELTEKSAKDPVLAWVRNHIKTLYSIQSGQPKLEDIFGAAGEAIALDAPEAEGENFYLRLMAILGSEIVEDTIAGCAGKSERLKKEERTKLQAEADKAHAAWKEFFEKSEKKVLDRHRDLAERNDRLSDTTKAFPVELTQLATFDIDACYMRDPGPELYKMERELMEIDSTLPRRVAIESRQELYTKLVTAGALRRFIQGQSESDIILELRQYRDKLKTAGGPINPGQYGPRVKKVFDGL